MIANHSVSMNTMENEVIVEDLENEPTANNLPLRGRPRD